MPDKLLTLKEAAECLHLDEKQVRRLVEEGKIPAYHIGGMYLRFKEENIFSIRGKYGGNLVYDIMKSQKNSGLLNNPVISAVSDFFYFNDFYIAAGAVIIFLVYVILKSIS
jgi:excisionase family DNA binding protein